MCIVIDINSLPSVFNSNCATHSEFAPVRDWINSKKGFLVYGGSKYKKELKKTFRYFRLVRKLKDAGKAIPISDSLVDKSEDNISEKVSGTGCDDQHIVSLLGVSYCPLLCSVDLRSFKYIKDRTLYPKGMSQVRIYSSSRNKNLLSKMCVSMLKNTV